MTHDKLLGLLRKGKILIEEIDLLIFDECHHCAKDHPYVNIFQEFYFYGLKRDEKDQFIFEGVERPKILGLTASPIKTRIKEGQTCMLIEAES